MFFPDVPAVLGVPALPRIPPVIYNQISSSLGGASRSMTSAALAVALNPGAAASSILDSVTSASAQVSTAAASLAQYPSALFNSFTAPVAQLGSSLSDLADTIGGAPSAPLSSVADSVNVTADQLEFTSADFDAGTQAAVGAPTVDDGSVETVTVTAYKSDVTWGIILNGKAVIQGDNFVSLEYKQEWVIADYQVEQGGFASYDKVATPFDARITVSCGGSVDKRAAFLASIQAIAGDLLLYDISTPEGPLQSVNVAHVDYKRTNIQGVGLITVYIYLLEIRETGEAAFATAQSTPASPTATKSPAGAATQSGGTIQTVPATATQNSAAFLNAGQLAAPIPNFQ